ncbi:hypothetical protein [Mycobacteroides salmoniphilum]|uniref:Uncharacterized protein n=1 Tax=Mycobacteroides salmoniphilum TaxID=404941 RepID=A0A4R8T1C0_9MYCO|nr:hypothetical protein [Mycobacteroides salmoniphilum]TEA09198.1 hypothetical protein CCUG60884_00188 [Mycobacteroides salmoniphilum]
MDIDELIRHYTADGAIRQMALDNGWKQSPWLRTPGEWDEKWCRGDLLVLVNYTPRSEESPQRFAGEGMCDVGEDNAAICDAVVVHLRDPHRLGVAYRINHHTGHDRIVLHELHTIFTRERTSSEFCDDDETEINEWIEEVADGDWLAVPNGNRRIKESTTGVRRRLAALRIRGERAAAPAVIEPDPEPTLGRVVIILGALLATASAGMAVAPWLAAMSVPLALIVATVVLLPVLVGVLMSIALTKGLPRKAWNKILDAAAPIEISPWATVPSVITGRRYVDINDRPVLAGVHIRPIPPRGRVGKDCAIYLVAEQICQSISRGHGSVLIDHGQPCAAAFDAVDPSELIDVEAELREVAHAVADLIAHTELIEHHAKDTVSADDGRQAVDAERVALIRRVTALYTYDRRLDQTVQRQRSGRKTPDFRRELLALVGTQQPADFGAGFATHVSQMFGRAWLHDDATDRIHSTTRRLTDPRHDVPPSPSS